MPLATTHSNWIRGSYVADLQFLLKIAENHPLSLNPSATNIGPDIDTKDRLVIGYGYDLWANRNTAIQELTAAGASISNAAQLQQLLSRLVPPVTATLQGQVASLLTLPTEAVATTLLQNAIAAREASFKSVPNRFRPHDSGFQ